MPEVQRTRHGSADAGPGATPCANCRADAVFIFVQQQLRRLSAFGQRTLTVVQQLALCSGSDKMKRSGGRDAATLFQQR
jgi:hypothetical protein